MKRSNFLQTPAIRWLFVNRWPQLIIRLIILAAFILVILGGFVGTPVGNRNISIVFVWIAWWGLLILFAVPLVGRGWCNVCPIPMIGEWLQQGTILGPQSTSKPNGLQKRWPKIFRNIWLQNGFFLSLAIFSTLILTNPFITSLALLALMVISIIISLIFERRAFCRYICPVSGFIGLYSQTAPIEVRVIDPQVCIKHPQKTCYTGDENGYGCPWGLFPAAITKNVNCGTCMECLRSCPYDNMTINLRPVGTDLFNPRERKLDEAFKTFIMLGSAMIYSLVLLGPWGTIKMAAYSIGSLSWFLYVVALLGFVMILLPGLLYFGLLIARKPGDRSNVKKTFIHQAYALVPAGLAAWVAFSLSFVFANFSYVIATLSDPFGFGWNLFGTANLSWQPYLSPGIPFTQVVVILSGLAGSIYTAKRIAQETKQARQALPTMLLSMVLSIGLIWLLIA